MAAKLKKLNRLGRPLLLASGLGLIAMGLLVIAVPGELLHKLLAALVFASGVIILLLGILLSRMDVFRLILRHVQYLTQSSEYTARLVREITEVMKAIEEAEAEESRQKTARESGNAKDAAAQSKEDPEIDEAVRQFEV